MDSAVLDLLAFYQRELMECPEGQTLLKKLGITSPEVIDHFHLGYCSGAALSVMSEETLSVLKKIGLVYGRGHGDERFRGALILPVYNSENQLVDLYGIRAYANKANARKPIFWQTPPLGLIGIDVLPVYPEIILCDDVFTALHVRQHGFTNVVSLRRYSELKNQISLFEQHNIDRVYLASRQHTKKMMPLIKKRGIDVIAISYASNQSVITKKSLQIVGRVREKKTVSKVEVVARSDSRIHLSAGAVKYRIDSTALSGLGMRVQIKAEKESSSFLDRLDLANASARNKFSKLCAGRLGLSSREIEEHLNKITDEIDRLTLEEADSASREPRALSGKEEAEALKLLKNKNLLELQAQALEKHCLIIGEEQNRKLAVLVAASRLLPKPLGAILRGSPSSGKSSLIKSVTSLLPVSEVLYLSRLTAASLYYMKREDLHHKLMVIDEWEGLADTEYPVRSMMSNQLLSLAITTRDGGRTPTTKLVEIPATLALLVSATKAVNIENLSRFLELRMDSSPTQTKLVLEAFAAAQADKQSGGGAEITLIQNANQLLKPVRVVIPFAKKLVYGTTSVFARRQFGQVAGLIQAHAALNQFRRNRDNDTIQADKEDYAAVYELLPAIIDHVEESLSPSAMELLDRVKQDETRQITVRQIMSAMAWSYSKTFRTMRELVSLNLMIPDKTTVGVERVYEPAPYIRAERGIGQLPDPKCL